MKVTLIGGPTVLIELDGFRLPTDPTFDPAGGEHPLQHVGLRKTRPAVHLTIDTNDAIETAHACPDARIVPGPHRWMGAFHAERD